jgi:hypothetical protein
VLVDRAALHRYAVPHSGDRAIEPGRAVHDEELGPLQAAPDEIVEHRPPGFGARAAHGLDREQDLLAVRAHSDDNQAARLMWPCGRAAPACERTDRASSRKRLSWGPPDHRRSPCAEFNCRGALQPNVALRPLDLA